MVDPGAYTGQYYNYCVSLLIQSLHLIDQPINIVFGSPYFEFNNNNRTIRIDIQPEHTLVKLGGRSVDEIIYGDVDLLNEEGKYLVRVPNYDYYSSLDIAIEYSCPNIKNMSTNEKFSDYCGS
jgi:hypothetical protein